MSASRLCRIYGNGFRLHPLKNKVQCRSVITYVFIEVKDSLTGKKTIGRGISPECNT